MSIFKKSINTFSEKVNWGRALVFLRSKIVVYLLIG
jgi:hypothetical protein